MPTDDLRFMRRALALARRGTGAVWPNPKVGCVVVKDGKIIGEGWHARCGGPHAEAAALRHAAESVRGSTVYATLEPCTAHPGKRTPPCAPALLAAGAARVVIATPDPNPAVGGRGIELLRDCGVRVAVGLLAREARGINRDFFQRMERGRPHVILKTALSLDGQAHAAGGASRWITSSAARKLVHRMRSQADAVLVGVGTVLADDPALTSHGSGKDPVRIVLDARLRTPRRSRVLDGQAPTWIFSSARGRRRNAEIIRLPARGGRLPLRSVLAELSRRGIGTLLVEGGPTVHASFLAEGLVDEARVFIAPKLLSGSRDPNRAPTLKNPRLRKTGPDYLFYGKVTCSRE